MNMVKEKISQIKNWWSNLTQRQKQMIQIPSICLGFAVAFFILVYTISFLGS